MAQLEVALPAVCWAAGRDYCRRDDLHGQDRVGRTTYSYTDATTGQTTTWSSGTDWTSAAPVSSTTTDLTFFNTTLASGFTNTNNDNITGSSGLFSLNVLTLDGTGPSSGTGATITIGAVSPGTGLDFVGASTPSI